jgi:hypothetical protein
MGGASMVTACMAEASTIAERHPGWQAWASRPVAVRTAAIHRRPDPKDGIYAETLFCETWRELDKQLAQQDENDERWAA